MPLSYIIQGNYYSDFYHRQLALLIPEIHLSGIIQSEFFHIWLLLLRIMLLRYIHVLCAPVDPPFYC